MPLEELLFGLNEDQKEAVMYVNGPLLIIAGPGTGKTLTITKRIQYLLHNGIAPHEIIALTFTNRAAREMKERLGEKYENMFIGTFHMFGLNILRQYNNTNLKILTKEEQIEILKLLTATNTKKAKSLINHISRIKNFYDINSMKDSLFLKYENALKEINAFDIDDLINKPIELIKSSEKIRTYLFRLKHILIDEYQDINPSQYILIKTLYDFTENICAVGDLDQAIYAFRGADIRPFMDFKKDFKHAKYVFLKENYRSSNIIIDASQAVIKNNSTRIEHPLYGRNSYKTEKLKIIHVENEFEEAKTIVGEIEKRIGAISHLRLAQSDFRDNLWGHAYSFSDFGVFFRTNKQAKIIEDALIESGIPYQIINDAFYEEIGDVIKRLEKCMENIDTEKTLIDILDTSFSNDEKQRLSGLKRNLFMAYGKYPIEIALKKILDELYVFRSEDTFNKDMDAVSLMTLHMSKGLEFKVVFIAGFEEGLIPYGAKEDEIDIEEERRLFYVGMTRAKEELFLLYSNKRHINGRLNWCKRSRFFYEIPEALMESIYVSQKERFKKKPKQESLF